MSSELRVNKLTSRSGVGTVSFNDSGLIITGIATAAVLDITGNATLGSATISGVLSYDDVTNVDSVGIVTAAGGVDTNTIRGKTNDSNVAFGARASNGAHVISLILKPDRTATFDGDISIADKIIHTGDDNTAIRFPAADTFTVETGGSERFRIDSTGNTLIYGVLRKDNVNSSLSISGGNGADSSANIVLHGSGGSPANVTQFRTGSTERLRIDSAGRIGIGTNNPQTLQHLKSDDPTIRIQRNNQSAYGDITTDTSGKIVFKSDPGGTASGDGFSFTVNNLEKLRITSAGDVGISSTAPITDVDISQKTGAVALPQGTTAQRPSGNAPYIRKNTTNSALEFYNGTNWVEIITDYFPSGSTTLG